MIILLCGPDEYRREEKRRAIITEFSRRHAAANIAMFDASDPDARDAFRVFSASEGLFDPARLAALTHAYSDDRAYRDALKKRAADSGLTVVLSERTSPPGPYRFLTTTSRTKKASPEAFVAQKFEYLSGAAWESYLAEAARERDVLLDPAATRYLAVMYAGDTWRAITEIERLSGIGRRVTPRDLDALGLEAAPEFFGHVLGLRAQSVQARLGALERALAANEPPAKLFNVLAYQWREKIAAIARCDAAVKSGRYDYEEALLDLVVS